MQVTPVGAAHCESSKGVVSHGGTDCNAGADKPRGAQHYIHTNIGLGLVLQRLGIRRSRIQECALRYSFSNSSTHHPGDHRHALCGFQAQQIDATLVHDLGISY